MRRSVFCSFLLFVCLTAFAQQKAKVNESVPQWKVVKVISLVDQTEAVPLTTLLTPKSNGVYQTELYISSASENDWSLTLSWVDLGNDPMSLTEDISGFAGGSNEQNHWVFSPLPGTPITYQISGSGSTPYNYTVVIEKLGDAE
jgi:hypothetical protein